MDQSADETFQELLRRVRAGDQDAAAVLARRYEPAIRRAVHYRLKQGGLDRLMDSTDVCQSVLASFFLRAADGQYEVEHDDQLRGLLAAMARTKLLFQMRKQRAQRRDHRRVAGGGLDEQALPGNVGTPSRQVRAKEMLAEVHRRLSAEERQLAEWRAEGLSWEEIAERVGGSPEALRKKLSRALERLCQDLGVNE